MSLPVFERMRAIQEMCAVAQPSLHDKLCHQGSACVKIQPLLDFRKGSRTQKYLVRSEALLKRMIPGCMSCKFDKHHGVKSTLQLPMLFVYSETAQTLKVIFETKPMDGSTEVKLKRAFGRRSEAQPQTL